MTTAARTLALYVVPASVVAAAWLRLEEPRGGLWEALWLLLLAVLPALIRPGFLRAAAVVLVSVVAAYAALGVSILAAPPLAHGDLLGPLPSRFVDGVRGFYELNLPFRASEHPLMHGVVGLAVFGFCLTLALALADRVPVAAVVVVLVGAGWPTALLPGDGELLRGAAILGAALWILAGTQITAVRRSLAPTAFAGAAVVVVALAVSSSDAVAKGGALEWREWKLSSGIERVGVSYIWDAQYDGIRYPPDETPVLQIEAPPRPLYWRATTLDAFRRDRWVEAHRDVTVEYPEETIAVPRNPLLPRQARDLSRLVRQHVTVLGLRDPRLVAAGAPVAYDDAQVGAVRYLNDGVARSMYPLPQRTAYTAFSYVARPTPRALARSKPRYARTLKRYLTVGRARMPRYGAPRRKRTVIRSLRRAGLVSYTPMFRQARRVVRGAKTPYGAAVTLEAWLRARGGFRYDEQPPRAGGPPLVDFVMRTKRGYCQHYAGAMAVMLRLLGVPARVAAGFTSGRYNSASGTWTVTDGNAHAWVEVWFDGYGWLPFDPTPGRGTLSAPYTVASRDFDAAGAVVAVGAAAAAARGLASLARRPDRGAARPQPGGPAGGPAAERDDGRLPVWLAVVVLAAAALVALVALAKLARRRARYLTTDPRRLAAACRAELVDFLADQRVRAPPGATLAELGAAVEDEFGVSAARFADAAAGARFAPPADAAGAAGAAREELHALFAAVRRRLSRRERVRGLLSLRSLRASA